MRSPIVRRCREFLGLALFACALPLGTAAAAAESPVYELRIYTATPGHLGDLIARFANDTCRIFEKHGMKNIVYWVPVDEKDGANNTLVYLLAHQSRDAAKASWKAFMDDPEWHRVRDASEAAGKIVAKVESTFLAPTDYSPALPQPGGKRAGIFELRTYKTPEGKLGALDARFRDHTLALFEKHGMKNGPYFHPTDAAKGADNTLIYWLTHESREAATASWKAFRDDPAWVAARTASEADGKLTTEVKSVFLQPVEFSPLK